MDYKEALRKAAACLRLANSSNAVEAALAAARAQEIIDKYNIEAAALAEENGDRTPEEKIENFANDPVLTACQKDKQWMNRLVQVVGRHNGCKMYFRDRAGGCACFLIGRKTDVETASYMSKLLAEEVRRLNREECPGMSDKYRRDFKYGVVDAIANKFNTTWAKSKKEAQQEATSSTALVRVNNAITKLEKRLGEVEEWAKNNMKIRESKSNYNPLDNARSHGFTAGQSIEINRAKGGLTSGAAQLNK